MKKILFLLFFLLSINVNASNRSVIVMDTDSKRILYQENANERKLIASTTKIMTFVVAYEYGKDFLDLEIEAGEEILKMYGTSIYLSYHEKMKLIDLLYGLMMRSGNDAAVVIANFIGGSEDGFVKLMNKKASFLGMNNTIFSNPHGLDENTQNYSTAYDMALLSIYASKIPLYRKITSTKYYDVKTNVKAYSWINRNKMVFNYSNYTTGKTGYTPKAGKTFVSTAKKDNLELTIVTLNEPNIYDVHRMMYEEYFKKYQNKLIVSQKEFMINYPNLLIKNDLYYPLTDTEIDKITVTLKTFNQDNIIGELGIYLDNKEVIKEPLYERLINLNNKNTNNNWKNKIKNFFAKIF